MLSSRTYRLVLLLTLVALASVACAGRSPKRERATVTAAVREYVEPQHYTYRVVAVYPHSTSAYTQGLVWDSGRLLEGTGQYGQSELRRVRLDGRVEQNMRMDEKYFGEGITLLNGKIYQLTWMEGEAFVYDMDNFGLLKSFRYSGEGWGLTTDGEWLYMSNGSDKIFVLDPDTFARKRVISVMSGRRRVTSLNELEWIDGRIWANVYMTDTVVIIDPATGNVTGVVDFSKLLSPSDITPSTDVLNGIAYDPETGRIFVTGKNWNKLFEVEIVENHDR